MPPFCISSTQEPETVIAANQAYYQHLLANLTWWKGRVDSLKDMLMFWEKTLVHYEETLLWWKEEIQRFPDKRDTLQAQFEDSQTHTLAVREHIALLQEQIVCDEEKFTALQIQINHYRSVYGLVI